MAPELIKQNEKFLINVDKHLSQDLTSIRQDGLRAVLATDASFLSKMATLVDKSQRIYKSMKPLAFEACPPSVKGHYRTAWIDDYLKDYCYERDRFASMNQALILHQSICKSILSSLLREDSNGDDQMRYGQVLKASSDNNEWIDELEDLS